MVPRDLPYQFLQFSPPPPQMINGRPLNVQMKHLYNWLPTYIKYNYYIIFISMPFCLVCKYCIIVWKVGNQFESQAVQIVDDVIQSHLILTSSVSCYVCIISRFPCYSGIAEYWVDIVKPLSYYFHGTTVSTMLLTICVSPAELKT